MSLFSKKDTPIAGTPFAFEGASFEVQFVSAKPDPQNINVLEIKVRLVNKSAEVIDAYMVGFDVFSVFGDYITHVEGYSLTDIKSGNSHEQNFRFYLGNAPLAGNIALYPQNARMKNGAIWKAKVNEIEAAINSKFNVTLDMVAEQKSFRSRSLTAK